MDCFDLQDASSYDPRDPFLWTEQDTLVHTLLHVGTPATPGPYHKLREDVERSSGLDPIAVHFDIHALSLAIRVRLDSGLALPHKASKHRGTDQEENSHFLVISGLLTLGSSHLC